MLGQGLARAVAGYIGIPFIQVFDDRFLNGTSHPRQFSSTPALVISDPPKVPVIIVDDVATSGWHLEEASLALRALGISTVSFAWIGGTLAEGSKDITLGALLGHNKAG